MQTTLRPTEHSCTAVGAELFTLQSHQVGKWWPQILGFLNKVEDPEWTADEVFEAISQAQAQVWGVCCGNEILGIWITKVLISRKAKYGLVWICAGEGLQEGLALYPHIEGWFKEMGCKYIEIQGRPGWKKVMTDYEVKHVVLRKAL